MHTTFWWIIVHTHVNGCVLLISRLQDLLGRSQWPRDLRYRSAAALLLRLWVRFPSGHGCLSVVSLVCCQVEVSATSLLLIQRIPTDCGASLCVI